MAAAQGVSLCSASKARRPISAANGVRVLIALEAGNSCDASDTARPVSVMEQMGTVIRNHCAASAVEGKYWRNCHGWTNIDIVAVTSPTVAAIENPLTMGLFLPFGRCR
jgi:hypothetical protein